MTEEYQEPMTGEVPENELTPEELAEQEGKLTWVGSPDVPEAKKYSDGISDLFEFDNEPDTADLVSVDIERDIIDVNEDGGLDDLTDVSPEDIMGDDDIGQTPLNHQPARRRVLHRPIRRYLPPPGGMRGLQL